MPYAIAWFWVVVVRLGSICDGMFINRCWVIGWLRLEGCKKVIKYQLFIFKHAWFFVRA